MVGDARRALCKRCGRHRDECGEISWTGKCLDCAEYLLVENIYCLANKSGEPWARWRRGMILSVGGILPPNLIESR